MLSSTTSVRAFVPTRRYRPTSAKKSVSSKRSGRKHSARRPKSNNLDPSRMAGHPHVLFLFLDGVGIGTNDPETNPFFARRYESLERLWGGSAPQIRDGKRTTPHISLVPIGATLEV